MISRPVSISMSPIGGGFRRKWFLMASHPPALKIGSVVCSEDGDEATLKLYGFTVAKLVQTQPSSTRAASAKRREFFMLVPGEKRGMDWEMPLGAKGLYGFRAALSM